jgi:hypothetical protein
MTREFREGMNVEVAKNPGWGPGKIVHISNQHLHIIFRDLDGKEARVFTLDASAFNIAALQSDSILDNLPPLSEKDGHWHLSVSRISFAAAERTFLRHSPAGFSDPKYTEGERAGKDQADQMFHKHLGLKEFRSLMESDDMLPKAARLGCVEQLFPTNFGIGPASVLVRLIAFF